MSPDRSCARVSAETPGSESTISIFNKAPRLPLSRRAATLVKEEPGVLPISPKRYPGVLYYESESAQGFAYSVRAGAAEAFRKLLEQEGFRIDVFEPARAFEGRLKRTTEVTDACALVVYLANVATKSRQTTVRIEWAQPMGASCPIYMTSVPTIFVSVENPYRLLDVPRAIVDKLMGRSTFTGSSPVDPFCGRWDTRLG